MNIVDLWFSGSTKILPATKAPVQPQLQLPVVTPKPVKTVPPLNPVFNLAPSHQQTSHPSQQPITGIVMTTNPAQQTSSSSSMYATPSSSSSMTMFAAPQPGMIPSGMTLSTTSSTTTRQVMMQGTTMVGQPIPITVSIKQGDAAPSRGTISGMLHHSNTAPISTIGTVLRPS